VFIRSLRCSSGDVWAYKTSFKYKSSNSVVTNSTHIKKEKKRKEKDLSPQIIEDKQIMTYLSLLPYLLRIFLSRPLCHDIAEILLKVALNTIK
jgi:hypothetical protein